MHSRLRTLGGLAALLLLAWLPACGQEPLATLDLALEFGPDTLPPDTYAVRVYVLPALLEDGTTVECEMFVGPTATERIYDYTTELVVAPQLLTVEVGGDRAVLVEDLPEGLLVFVVEALDQSNSTLAWGCGKGQISRGQKTFISIFLEIT
ncbi:MAG TPA: hypothetical protein PK668_22180 [Myxococcota bacterium]|nr:hypothetical protein [Myxococcota bacterium]HRY96315.1 hypothetical protein [Myxococcota bacterium]